MTTDSVTSLHSACKNYYCMSALNRTDPFTPAAARLEDRRDETLLEEITTAEHERDKYLAAAGTMHCSDALFPAEC